MYKCMEVYRRMSLTVGPSIFPFIIYAIVDVWPWRGILIFLNPIIRACRNVTRRGWCSSVAAEFGSQGQWSVGLALWSPVGKGCHYIKRLSENSLGHLGRLVYIHCRLILPRFKPRGKPVPQLAPGKSSLILNRSMQLRQLWACFNRNQLKCIHTDSLLLPRVLAMWYLGSCKSSSPSLRVSEAVQPCYWRTWKTHSRAPSALTLQPSNSPPLRSFWWRTWKRPRMSTSKWDGLL